MHSFCSGTCSRLDFRLPFPASGDDKVTRASACIVRCWQAGGFQAETPCLNSMDGEDQGNTKRFLYFLGLRHAGVGGLEDILGGPDAGGVP